MGAPFHQRASGPFSVVYGYCLAGIAAREQLDLTSAEANFRHAMELASEVDDELSSGALMTGALLGELPYEQGHLANADLLERSHTLAAEGGVLDFVLAAYGTGAQLKLTLGQPDAAMARLEEAARVAQRFHLPRLKAGVVNEQVRADTRRAAIDDSDLDSGGDHSAIIRRQLN